jgi:hypothetical protein
MTGRKSMKQPSTKIARLKIAGRYKRLVEFFALPFRSCGDLFFSESLLDIAAF